MRNKATSEQNHLCNEGFRQLFTFLTTIHSAVHTLNDTKASGKVELAHH